MSEDRDPGKQRDRIELEVPTADAGERLDRYLARVLDVPRNQIQHWVREEWIEVHGRKVRTSMKVMAGDRILCQPLARSQHEDMEPEPGELVALHEDEHLIVLDKPADLTVHPGAGRSSGTLAHRLLHRYPEIAGVGGAGRPGIVHRLDKDTTGVLVIARTEIAYRKLNHAFAEREVRKTYLGIVYGSPDPPTGVIDLPIGRHFQKRMEMAVRKRGRPARTGFELVATGEGVSLLELDLETGRTHQIRVHLKATGHPLVGDPVYGEARWKGLPRRVHSPLKSFARPALHARLIEFRHPVGDELMRFAAPLPEDIRQLWEAVTGTPVPILTDSGVGSG